MMRLLRPNNQSVPKQEAIAGLNFQLSCNIPPLIASGRQVNKSRNLCVLCG